MPRADISIYQYYQHLVVSIDFIKTERNKRRFLDNAPDLVIVDEAHTAARPKGDQASAQHQRYAQLRDLASVRTRHVILTTATPHSGIEESFRSLLGLLDPSFDIPEDADLPFQNLLPHLVQRRRGDLIRWLGEDTPFPERLAEEHFYNMSAEYLNLFQGVLAYCRESVPGNGLRQQQQRVRYWAAIAILRCVLSSPAAAEVMLQQRAQRQARGPGSAEREETYSAQVLDSTDEEEPADYVPTAPLDDPDAALTQEDLRRLNSFLSAARRLGSSQFDAKLKKATEIVDGLLQDGFHPIVFCRFIATAKYVAQQLQESLARTHPKLRVVAVTGSDGDSEQREELGGQLAREPVRVLVATECLSEGINLQEHFDAVVHYDLPWNPNRLEQREGRVDRYGQKQSQVKAVMLYGADNPMDPTVLEVLIRKARTIRKRLGISVPVPVDSQAVVQAVVDSVLLRRAERGQQLQLALEDPKVSSFHVEWERAADREDRTRTYFAQHGVRPDEVAREITQMEPVLGSADDVRRFVGNVAQRFNGTLRETARLGVFRLDPGDLRSQIRARDPRLAFPLEIIFKGIPPNGVVFLGRNHPVVTTMCDAVLAKALSDADPVFARCGAMYTDAVTVRTAVLVLRLRYLIEETNRHFAEEAVVAAFVRQGNSLQWLEPLQEQGLKLIANPHITANMPPGERQQQVEWALGMLADNWYTPVVRQRVHALEESHARLRRVVKGKPLKVSPHVPPDILGCYVLVPSGGGR